MTRSTDRVPPAPKAAEITLQSVLEALADPVRRSVVAQLGAASEDISSGSFDLPVARSTATHHFNVLRDAGIIHQYYVGTSRMNRLRRADLDAILPGLLDACLHATAQQQ
jgi:DNA-binding transcriptional ArsR family regulator